MRERPLFLIGGIASHLHIKIREELKGKSTDAEEEEEEEEEVAERQQLAPQEEEEEEEARNGAAQAKPGLLPAIARGSLVDCDGAAAGG